MNFKLDENLPVEVALLLQQEGHQVTTVPAQNLTGSPDHTVARACALEGFALLTLDTDFADIRSYPPSEYSGIVVFRLRQQDKPHLMAIMLRVLQGPSTEPLERRLWIVEEGRIRIRE